MTNLVYFKNSSLYFTESDHAIFKEITGNSIEELESDIQNLDQNIINMIYSNHKFIDNKKLNLKGLHVYRTLLANKIYSKRGTTDNENIKSFFENGFLTIEDFLDKKEFNGLKDIFNNKIKTKESNHYITRVNGENFLNRNQELYNLIKGCARINNFSFGSPRVEFWNLKHIKEDPQSRFHSDTFQPTCKFWILLEDINIDKGPFNYVPGSHILTKQRLVWDYENSIMQKDTDLWKTRIQSGGKPGSFRVHENCSIEKEINKIKSMSYKIKEVVGKENTLIAANTFGFHKRGIAEPGTSRETLSIEYRPQAFCLY